MGKTLEKDVLFAKEVDRKASKIANVVGLTAGVLYWAGMAGEICREAPNFREEAANLALWLFIGPLYAGMAYCVSAVVAYGISFPFLNRKR